MKKILKVFIPLALGFTMGFSISKFIKSQINKDSLGTKAAWAVTASASVLASAGYFAGKEISEKTRKKKRWELWEGKYDETLEDIKKQISIEDIEKPEPEEKNVDTEIEK